MTFGPGEMYSLACALAWAIAVILFKKSGESLSPLALNLVKNLIGLALMLLTALAVNGPVLPPIPADAVAVALVSGLLGIGVGDTLYFRALNAIGASRMAVAQTLYSPFVIGLSALFLAERLLGSQWLGVVLVLAGVLLVNWLPGAAPAGMDPARLRRGALDGMLSVFVMAAGVVMAKPLLEQHDFLWIVTIRIVGGTLGLPLMLLFGPGRAAVRAELAAVRHWPQIVAGSVMGTYLSMLLWLAGYKYTQASVAAVLNELAAVFILALAALFLGERSTRRQLAGAGCAICGVVLVVWRS